MPVSIRCRYCGARENISETTLKSLGSGNSVVRTCITCSAGTPWDMVGEGSTFAGARVFRRDLDEEGDEASDPHVAQPTSDALKPRVLLVDDDQEVLSVLAKALSAEALDVETAGSGRLALNLLVREDFDLILCDVRMPDFDGKQLFDFVCEHLPEQRDRVVFLTGDVGTESTIEFLQQAGLPYLPKPVELPRLMQVVRERLGREPRGESLVPGLAAKPAS